MVLHVYHAALEDLEFEFTIDVNINLPGGFTHAVDAALEEVSETMLEQVRDAIHNNNNNNNKGKLLCCICQDAEATRLIHHPMLFNTVIPARIEDVPAAVCPTIACAAAAQRKQKEELQEALHLFHNTIPLIPTPTVCNYCRGNKVQSRPLQRCSRCKSVWYCDRECQMKDWAVHKRVCIIAPSEVS